MNIRPYVPSDYYLLKQLYEKEGVFDKETDREMRLQDFIKKNPKAFLICIDNNEIVGTATFLDTGRIALVFRLVTIEYYDEEKVRKELLERAENYFKDKGYKEMHILALESDESKHNIYESLGFTKGNTYRWFWKTMK